MVSIDPAMLRPLKPMPGAVGRKKATAAPAGADRRLDGRLASGRAMIKFWDRRAA